MSNEDFDPFKLSSGLPLVGADVTVKEVEFGYDNTYSADACVAMITFEPDEGETQRQLYSIGKNFEPADRGSTLTHKSGKNVNLNDNSNYGRFVKAFTDMADAKGALAETRERGTGPFDAAWLVGMKFTLGELKYINTMTGTAVDKTLIVPVTYNGVASAKGSKAAAKAAPKLAPKAAGKAAVKKADPNEDEDFGIDDADVLATLIEAAQEAEDHEAFTDAALEVDGVASNKVWTRIIMSSKPGSLWATHGE